MNRRILFGLLAVLNISFLVYYIYLAYNMRMHYDDLHFLWRAQEQSLFEFLEWVFYDRSGRMSVYGFNWIASYTTNLIGCYQFWPILFMLIGWWYCWIFARNMKLALHKVELFLVVIFIYNLYILTSIDFAVFYWLAAIPYYLIAPATLAMLSYLNQPILKWNQWLMLSVLVICIGLGYEYWIPIALLLMFFCGMWHLRKYHYNFKEAWRDSIIRRIVCVAGVLLLFFVFITSAPGMHNRVDGGVECEGMIHPENVVEMLKAYVSAGLSFVYFMLFYVPYYLVVFALFVYIGSKDKEVRKCASWKTIGWIILLFAIVVAVMLVIPAYIYGGFGIQRFYTPLVLLLIMCFGVVGYMCGVLYRNTKKFSYISAILGVFVLTCVMIINMYIDFPLAKEWSSAIDQRKEYLLTLRDNGNTEPVDLEPLPNPATIDIKYVVTKLIGGNPQRIQTLYYTSDVKLIPSDYDIFLEKAYHLGYDVRAKQ